MVSLLLFYVCIMYLFLTKEETEASDLPEAGERTLIEWHKMESSTLHYFDPDNNITGDL